MSKSKEDYINKLFLHDRGEFHSEITITARSFIIANEITAGLSYRQIVSKYMNEWGVSYNYMKNCINEAIDMFKAPEIYLNMKEVNNERLTEIYQKAREREDLDTAIKAIDKLNKSNGVYDLPKTQVNVQTDDSNVTITFGGVSVEEAEARFRNNSESAPFNEVDDIINKALDKNELK